LFKLNDVGEISTIIDFPLNREHSIPSVKDEKYFKLRYSEIFDKTIINKIANSKIENWSEVDWREIMLNNGIVWIDIEEGNIVSVNYQSDFERN
jgi:hypothetical protein